MKNLMLGVLMFSAAVMTAAPTDRPEKMRSVPVTVYPNFDPRGSSLVKTVNSFMSPHDAVVVSYTDAFKGSFRIADVGVTRGQVWIYVAEAASLTGTYGKNLEGAGGIVYVPAGLHSATDARRVARELADEAKVLGVPLIVGLNERALRSVAAIADVARSGAIFTVYASAHLTGSREAYRQHVEKIIRAARAENPQIKVELAIAATESPAARQHVLALISANIDLADRVAIYCGDGEESVESLKALFGMLRPAVGQLTSR